MPIDSISRETISKVAHKVFGKEAEVVSVREIRSEEEHGITRIPTATRNNVYIVDLAPSQRFIFRFSRYPDEDRYLKEVHHYEQIRQNTRVRVPTVHCVDRSKELAPTPYMILEFLPGEHWHYLTHPDNPETSPREKAAIDRKAGQCFAQVHRITTEIDEVDKEARIVSTIIDRLEHAMQNDVLDFDPEKLAQCRRAIAQESAFRSDRLSFCITDAELKFAKQNGVWELCCTLDVEWAGFRNRYSDLAAMLPRPARLHEPSRPLCYGDPAEVAARPFYQAYEEELPVDYEKLLHLSVYYQLDILSYLAVEQSAPEKKQWLRAAKGPLIHELVDLIAERATDEQTMEPATAAR